MRKMNENKAKPTKTSTRLGKVSKAETKEAIYLRKNLKRQFKSLKIQRMTKETLSGSVKILTRKILQVFTSCRF